MAEYDDVKRDVAVANRIVAYMGLATGVRASLGHVSQRLPSDPTKFVVKGRGYRIDVMSRMRPEDMVLCDLEANWLDGPPESMQPGEVKMHSCIYKARPDVQSVLHVHPKFTVVMSTLKQRLYPMVQEGVSVVRNALPVYPKTKVVTTEEEGREVATILADAPVVLLLGHGAASTGKTLEESVMRMIWLEHQAEANYWAYAAAGKDHDYMPDENADDVMNSAAFSQPHFLARTSKVGMPKGGGIWGWLTREVTPDF
ncbi:MAG: class II aldolase/adducin family protein [Dehalococcoidia bacterium]|nr:class II aldolase/adducin family protein [Dehalococcoidia bacterium]